MPTHHDVEGEVRSSSDMLDTITTLLESDGGAFGLSYNPEKQEWMAVLQWGREAEDSDMAGAAAYGVQPVAAAAVEQMLREAGR